jgi:2-dehydropantoate 2-reductase
LADVRYVIYGAGGVGCVIGARLFQHGHDVVLIARGDHLGALQKDGLELRSPEETVVLPIPAVGSPAGLTLGDDDVVVLAMKSHDTVAAVAALPDDVAVVCAQNGVNNERVCARRFADVYGMCVMLPALFLEPGVVESHAGPKSGILDVGRYPLGVDDRARAIATDLDASQFSSVADPAIMRQKYAKLVMNLGNALEAACGTDARGGELWASARDEAVACFEAAGIDYATEEEDKARRGEHFRLRPVNGQRRPGGSTFQSLARGAAAVETDYLNGEIVLLGRLHGIPTPVNAVLQRTANRMAREGVAPGTLALDELLAELP